jgi:hypothetical protein
MKWNNFKPFRWFFALFPRQCARRDYWFWLERGIKRKDSYGETVAIKKVTYAESREAFFEKELKRAERGLGYLIKYDTDHDARTEAGKEVSYYRDALAALREQAGRANGCPICQDPRTFEGVGVSNKFNDRYHVYLCGGISRPPEDERFVLCPVCGKRLEVKQG